MIGNIKEEIENKIIDCIVSGTGGRLIIFEPEKDLFGEDLVVEKRGGYKNKKLFLKIGSFIGPPKSDNLKEYSLADDFKANENLFLIFVYFDKVAQKIGDDLWFMPSLSFEKNSDKDKFLKFLIKKESLGALIMNLL